MYIEQPQGFEVHGKESHVCRLKKALYDLKQAPRAWYSRIYTYFQEVGFTKSEADLNLYYIVIGEEPLILVLYVDDLVITGAERLIEGCKRDIASEFKMKDIGLMHHFWVWRCGRRRGISSWDRGSTLWTFLADFTWRIVNPCRHL